MGEKLVDYGKGLIQKGINELKNKITTKITTKIFTNPYVLLALAIITLLAFTITAMSGAITVEGAVEEETSMQAATTNSWEQFIRYLHQCEGEGTIEKNSTGEDCYKVENKAVGYGVDIDTHGAKLREAGYDTSNGSLIPVSVVDAIEKAEVEERYSDVESLATSNNIELTQYQMYALTSRAYNYGKTGGLYQAPDWFIYPSDLNFVEAYKKYYTSINSDEYYGDYTKTDFKNELFTQYMIWLDRGKNFGKDEGTHPDGWETRRKSEWCLFQTGYYGWGMKNGNVYPEGFDEYCSDRKASNGFLDNSKVYNADGSVNETAILQLQSDLEDSYGLVKCSSALNQSKSIGEQYNKTACESVIGDYFKFTKWCSKGMPDSVFGCVHVYQCTWWAEARASSYLGKNVIVSGNGVDVANAMVKAGYGESSDEPIANSVISYSSGKGNGHVAYIEAVDTVNKYYYISHAGNGETWYGIHKISYKDGLSKSKCFGYSFNGICVLWK